MLFGQFRNILIIVLLGAAARSALFGEIVDVVIIFIIVGFSALLGFVQEYRAQRAVEFVIALNCRPLVYGIFSAPSHRWLIIALAWELVLIAVLVQIPAVRQAFGIAIPSAADLVMVVIEASKVILRRYTATLVTK